MLPVIDFLLSLLSSNHIVQLSSFQHVNLVKESVALGA